MISVDALAGAAMVIGPAAFAGAAFKDGRNVLGIVFLTASVWMAIFNIAIGLAA